MTNDQCMWQQELRERFPQCYDPEYVPVWHAYWGDYEESGYFYLLERNGQLYVQEGGHCVMAEDNTEHWLPYAVSYDDAIQLLIEWEEHLE